MAGPQALCIGESMVLVTPVAPIPLMDADLFHLDVAGAESTVALYLQDLGVRAAWASRVGDDALGRRVQRTIAGHGVDTSLVQVDPVGPTGVYFKDPQDLSTRVHYYRRGSAASRMGVEDLRRLPLGEVWVVHATGITAALSASCRQLMRALFHDMQGAAPALRSFDVNYRPGLWSVDEAAPVLAELAGVADIVFVGQDEAEALWGATTPGDVVGALDPRGTVVVKDGGIGATEISSAGEVFSPAGDVEVVEVLGAGDAFAAGYLAGVAEGLAPEQSLAQGHRVAARALATTSDYVPAEPRGS
jgi:2-dehydro-3-deoxygluconokinase